MKSLKSLALFCTFGLLLSCSQTKESSNENVDSEQEMSNLEKEHTLEKASYADSVNLGLVEDTFKGSARREAKGTIGSSNVTVNYGSPGTRGRVIWNGLVSYDQIWVSGSHWATAISFSNDVVVEGVTVPSGMYSFFTIPGRDEWTLILNKTYDMHLADDYKESENVVSIKTMPENLTESVQRLTYEIESAGDGTGFVSLSWDKIKVKMPIAEEK